MMIRCCRINNGSTHLFTTLLVHPFSKNEILDNQRQKWGYEGNFCWVLLQQIGYFSRTYQRKTFLLYI